MRPLRLSSRPALLGSFLVLTACAQVGGGGEGVSDTGPDSDDLCALPADHVAPTCGRIAIEDRDIEISTCEDFDYAELPDGCWKLAGTLTISGPAVTSVARLGGLQHVRGLILEDTGLASFDTQEVVTVAEGIVLRDNPELADISLLRFEDELDGAIIDNNARLESIGALGLVQTITGKATVTKNRRLRTLDMVASSMGSLLITDNATLTSVALPNLQTIGGGPVFVADLDIQRTPLLTALSIPRLRTVAGSLHIHDTGLVSLAGFGADLVVDWDVTITNNFGLADLGEVSRARSVDGMIEISDNGKLSCQAAREVGCCVNSGGFNADGNATSGCTTASSAWCRAANWAFQCFH